MTYEEMLKQAVVVRAKYDQLNERNGVSWNDQALMAGFVGDVGALSKIVLAKNGLRAMDDVDEKLAHELADCLWSVLVLADKFGINLANEYQKTMAALNERIDAKLR
ncbi:MAG TPA: hypothetical protein VIR03_00245 [Candidatus Saccharimonadales bacterium]